MNIISTSPACPKELEEATRLAKCFSDAYETVRPLSCHGICFVSLCVAKCTGLNVVVKTYLRHKLGSKGQLQVQTEIQIHSSLSNPNIVKLLLAFEDSRSIHLVMEYAEKGDLRQHMIGMTEQRARDIMALPILQALVVLQKEGVVHRDLKPDNVLMSENNQVMLADFGLSMYSSSAASPAATPLTDLDLQADVVAAADAAAEARAAHCCCLADSAAGTPLYSAPEVLSCMFRNQPMQAAVQPGNDVWALGVMLLEALSGSHPFDSSGNVMYNIANIKAVPLPSHLSPELADFLSLALHRDPELRPGADQLLTHPWVRAPPRCAKPCSCSSLHHLPCSASSLHLPSSGNPSSRSSEFGDDYCTAEELPLSSCGRFVQALDRHEGHYRGLSTFDEIDCWED